MNRCPAHQRQDPPAPADPFRPGPQPSSCKGCGAQVGTEAERLTHYCPCCGTRLARCRALNDSTCPQCGPISRDGEFRPPTDYMAELLAGRQQPTEEERAAALLRARLGEQIAHYVTVNYPRDGYMRATLARGSARIPLRVSIEAGWVEGGAPCGRGSCRGVVWVPVDARSLLRLYQHGAGGATTCDRCGGQG
ncbi:hypothetical protein ACFWA9_10175 [Kitasatospora sp. NPDC059973]|uniref:hypothetical protein n=1 Tax=Kitasatospora sp. NPDC059973 TaxID=3347020 RepID=UPI00369C0CEC